MYLTEQRVHYLIPIKSLSSRHHMFEYLLDILSLQESLGFVYSNSVAQYLNYVCVVTSDVKKIF